MDSPTCEIDDFRIILSLSASGQGEDVDRVLILAPPPGGLEGVPHSGALLCRLPSYGRKDAGRRRWLRIQDRLVGVGGLTRWCVPDSSSRR